MKTILVTGASGFIGQEFLKILKKKNLKKYKIVLLSSSPHKDFLTILHKNYIFKKQDFLKKKINHLDIIIHLGAFIPKSSIESNNINKSYENIRNTKYLIDNLPNTPEKFIFASSIDVYGKLSNKIQEDSETKPHTMYAQSKLFCENMIKHWAKEKKIIYQILRFGHIYGKGEENYKKVIPTTIRRIKNNKNPLIYGTGDDLRSFLHVSDLCKLIIKTTTLKKSNDVINLCNSKSLSIKSIIALLIKISKKKHLKIDHEKRKSDKIDYIFNTKKMRKLFKLRLITMKEGLKNEYEQ